VNLFFAALLLADTVTQVTAAEADHSTERVVITAGIVNRSNIFTGQFLAESDQTTRLFRSGVNRFHKTTRESVILRELGVVPGATITVEEVADFERRLRQLGLFAAVSAKLVTADAGVELHISTQDNFSIVTGGSGSYLGGVGNVGFTVGDKNLFGSGNKLLFKLSRTTDGNFRGSLAYSDLHFFDKAWRANYGMGRTDEGDFFSIDVGEPFKSISDDFSWELSAHQTEKDIKYYRDGSTVVRIPEDRLTVSGKSVWRSGSTQQYLRRGVVARYSEVGYSPSTGELADTIDTPTDNRTLYFGGILARDSIQSYSKVQGIDTLNYIQDISFGSSAEIQLGLNQIEEFEGTANRVEPTMSVALRKSFLAGKDTYLKFSLNGNGLFEESGGRPWSATTSFKAYYTGFDLNTLALRMEYATGEDGIGLPGQLTLGENNGLRGYDARQFEGRQRFRLNAETRYRPGWQFGTLNVGMIGFFDAGWAAERDNSSPSVRHAIGAGLRIGSSAFLGAAVIRLDVAIPLDPVAGENSDARFSFALGQVFGF